MGRGIRYDSMSYKHYLKKHEKLESKNFKIVQLL